MCGWAGEIPQFVEVVDGLEPGEKVIVSGYEAYQKMDRIEFDTVTRTRTDMIRLKHLAKVYRTDEVETTALRDMNLDVNPGEFAGRDGPVGLRQVHLPQHRGHAG